MAREPFQIALQDNSKVVVKTMEGDVAAALAAMGTKAVNLIQWRMSHGYGRPIWRSGDLRKDVQYEVNEGGKTVTVGNTLEYGVYVHEGTSQMKGRPYIKDALTGEDHMKQLQKAAEQELKKGFE